MSYTHSSLLLVKVLVSLVPIHYPPRICDPIVDPQVFKPASVIFSGIGVLLMVSIVFDLSVLAVISLTFLRRLKR